MICYWSFSKKAISVLQGSDARTVLQASSSKPAYSFITRNMKKFLGDKPILVLTGNEWRKHRTAIHKSFTPVALEKAQCGMHTVGKTLSESLLKAIDIQSDKSATLTRTVLPLMKIATLDVFGSTFLGVDFQSCANLKLPPVASSFEFLGEDFMRRNSNPLGLTVHLDSLPTNLNREFRRHRSVVRGYMAKQIEKAQIRIQEGNEEKHDLLTNIVKASHEQADCLESGLEAITDISVTLSFAGYNTTSIGLSYALYLLAKNPEVQKECVKEIKTVLNKTNGELPGPEALPYTQAVVMEALRIHSTVVLAARVLEKDLTLHGHVIPKNTNVSIPVWLLHRDDRNYPQPLEMRPDRWVQRKRTPQSTGSLWEDRPSDNNQSSDIAPGNRNAFLAFSAEARNCVGKNLTMREAVTLLAYPIRHVQFELVDKSYEVQHKVKLLQSPKDDLQWS